MREQQARKELENFGKLLDNLTLKPIIVRPVKLYEFIALTPELRAMQIEREYIPNEPIISLQSKI